MIFLFIFFLCIKNCVIKNISDKLNKKVNSGGIL